MLAFRHDTKIAPYVSPVRVEALPVVADERPVAHPGARGQHQLVASVVQGVQLNLHIILVVFLFVVSLSLGVGGGVVVEAGVLNQGTLVRLQPAS